MIVKQQAKREHTYYMCLQEKYKKVESINKQTDYKTMSKKWTVEKKTGLFFPYKQVQDRSKEFLENKIILIIKRFLGKASSHNYHYMVNMGGQRLKIGSNWPLISSYLQHCVIKNNIILYQFPFIKYLWITEILLVSTGLKSVEKDFTLPFNPAFSYYLKSFEILPKHRV